MDMVDGFGKVDIVRWSLGPEWVLIITVFEQQVWLTHLHGSLSLSPLKLMRACLRFLQWNFMWPQFCLRRGPSCVPLSFFIYCRVNTCEEREIPMLIVEQYFDGW